MIRKFVYLLPVLYLLSCNRDEIPLSSSLTLQLDYTVDQKNLFIDTSWYINSAGNSFTINHLEYYISGITFIRSAGDSVRISDYFYIDATKAEYASIQIRNIPMGSYESLVLHIGLLPDQNISYALPPTIENSNMAWPGMMGGGYHFMKLEGYLIQNTQQVGYAVHLGNNPHLVRCVIPMPFHLYAGHQNAKLVMNINEWFDHPSRYDLIQDGNYTMGDSLLMSKVAKNGQDVFTLKF